MTNKEQMYDAIFSEVKFCMYSVMIAEQLHKLGCDNIAWTREEFRDAIKSYPIDLELDAHFLIGKYEAVHANYERVSQKNICDTYLDILRDFSIADTPDSREHFAFALIDPLYISQVDDDQAEWPNVDYVLEQPTSLIEVDFLETSYICPHEFYHEPRYKVAQRDLMQFEKFDVDSLSQRQKEQFLRMPLHSHSPLNVRPDSDKSPGAVLDLGIVTGIAKAAIAHVHADESKDKTIQRALLASNVVKNSAAMAIAARMYGSYTVHSSDKDLTTDEILQIREKHCVLPGEANIANINGSSIAVGMAVFDACMGKGDPHQLIDHDHRTEKTWTINPEVFGSDVRLLSAETGLVNSEMLCINSPS